jgi:hypothetical protein
MAELRIAPYAPTLIESMRSVGYSLESAVADIIDNSISAGARKISVRYSPHDEPYVAILDDGSGMEADELTQAMRHGNRDPWGAHADTDLGRFGLGLKTASLSQCRKLTVITMKDRNLSARCWDIDLIIKREDWILHVPELEEIECMPLVNELRHRGRGTIVLWHQLDRLCAGESSINRALPEKMDTVRDHLALVFHRYLTGEPGLDKIEIRLNENPIVSADPFLTWHAATQPLQDEQIEVEGALILIKPYILPHITKLSPLELRCAGGEEGLRRNQGFYIYRNRRLIIWGTWFRIIRQEELSKLARVRVDIPSALDHLWTIDIKKSTAHPPEEVRQNFKRIIDKIVGTSRRVYTYRGRTTGNNKLVHSWTRVEARNGINYIINREHPAIVVFMDKLSTDDKKIFELILDTLEQTFPVDALYADMSSDRHSLFEDENRTDKLMELAQCLLRAAETVDGGRAKLLASLDCLEPFCQYPDITESIIKEISNAG